VGVRCRESEVKGVGCVESELEGEAVDIGRVG
jgi:hypothetical protein